MVSVGPSSGERLLTLDFEKLVFYRDYGSWFTANFEVWFSVEYLKEQAFEPEPTNDMHLAGKTIIVDNKQYCDAVRLRAIINRALDRGWVTSVCDYVWRFCLFSKNFRIINDDSGHVFYELMPGTGYGGVLIKAKDQVKEIVRLASKGYYVTRHMLVTGSSIKQVAGTVFDDNIVLVPDRYYQDLSE